MYTTRTAFFVSGSWRWFKWSHTEGNLHAAILDKAKEMNATGYDFGNADHFEADRYPHRSR